MSCDEKVKLATIYEAATAKFSGAVKELQQKIGAAFNRVEASSWKISLSGNSWRC